MNALDGLRIDSWHNPVITCFFAAQRWSDQILITACFVFLFHFSHSGNFRLMNFHVQDQFTAELVIVSADEAEHKAMICGHNYGKHFVGF